LPGWKRNVRQPLTIRVSVEIVAWLDGWACVRFSRGFNADENAID